MAPQIKETFPDPEQVLPPPQEVPLGELAIPSHGQAVLMEHIVSLCNLAINVPAALQVGAGQLTVLNAGKEASPFPGKHRQGKQHIKKTLS